MRFKVKIPFNPSIRFLKWQKYMYQNGEYIDIDIHKTKYTGSLNTLQDPVLQIRDIDKGDETKYRLQVRTTNITSYSEECCLKVLPISGEFAFMPCQIN